MPAVIKDLTEEPFQAGAGADKIQAYDSVAAFLELAFNGLNDAWIPRRALKSRPAEAPRIEDDGRVEVLYRRVHCQQFISEGFSPFTIAILPSRKILSFRFEF